MIAFLACLPLLCRSHDAFCLPLSTSSSLTRAQEKNGGIITSAVREDTLVDFANEGDFFTRPRTRVEVRRKTGRAEVEAEDIARVIMEDWEEEREPCFVGIFSGGERRDERMVVRRRRGGEDSFG